MDLQADAGIAQGARMASVVHEAEARQTADELREVAADPELRRAMANGRIGAARARIDQLIGGDVEAIEIRSPQGGLLAQAGSASAVAPPRRDGPG